MREKNLISCTLYVIRPRLIYITSVTYVNSAMQANAVYKYNVKGPLYVPFYGILREQFSHFSNPYKKKVYRVRISLQSPRIAGLTWLISTLNKTYKYVHIFTIYRYINCSKLDSIYLGQVVKL